MITALPDDLDADVVAAVQRRLDEVVAAEQVRICWAIESGSRAWGFPSPDSDYDCRFIYVRPADDYLALWPPRDVIETPLDDLLDVNGWDLAKAVRLAVVGNATVVEWLRSPLVYRGDPMFRDALLDLCGQVVNPAGIRRHYLHLGRAQWDRAGAGEGDSVPLKKVFYALRSAAALRWLRHHESAVPPMRLQELLAEAPVDADVQTYIDELVAAKAITRELGSGRLPQPVIDFVAGEFELAERAGEPADQSARLAAARQTAEAGFRALVAAFAS